MINCYPYHLRITAGLVALLTTFPVLAAELEQRWSVENVFMMPESATYDSERDQVFVSNVNEYAKDGNGFVSRVSGDGQTVQVKWLEGLNSPTGMVADHGRLYIADYDELIIADIEEGKVIKRIPAPDSKPVLNDVAVSPTGRVFVSGSASRSIYELKQDELLIWKHDSQLLKAANGLFVDGGRLVHGGWEWSVFDMQSKELVADFKAPDEAIKDIDGITTDGCGGFLLTLIDDKRIWRIRQDGSSEPLSEQAINGIDLQNVDGTLYVPVVGNSLRVFDLPSGVCGVDSD